MAELLCQKIDDLKLQATTILAKALRSMLPTGPPTIEPI